MNASVVVPIKTCGDLRQMTNDERKAIWACRYFSAGHHRNPEPGSLSRGERYAAAECACGTPEPVNFAARSGE